MRALPLVHIGAARGDRAGAVAHDHVFVRNAHRLDQCGTGEGRCARTVDHHLAVLQLAARHMAGVDQAGGGDDRGAVLVVMHHRDVHLFAQGLLDNEAFGRGDIFQIDAAEAGFHQRHGIDEGFRVFGVEFEIDRIHIGETLEQDGLAFHHRLRRERAQIAEAQDRSAVGNHRHEVGPCGIARRILGIGGNRLDRGRNARRIGQRQIALGRHGLARNDLDLTGTDRFVIEQRFARVETVLLFVGHACPFGRVSDVSCPPLRGFCAKS